MQFINMRFKNSLLEKLNLPDIDYPILFNALHENLENGILPYAHMLFGLQNLKDETTEITKVKEILAHTITPDDNRDIITARGDDWWIELGPVNMDGEMVTIQRKNKLIAIIQPTNHGRLRVSTYTMLDKRCLSILIGASMMPHPQFGVCMRENNWEYIKDQSALMSNVYQDRAGNSYLSYWNLGLGISNNKDIIDMWYSQRKLNRIKPNIIATELGIYYMLSG